MLEKMQVFRKVLHLRQRLFASLRVTLSGCVLLESKAIVLVATLYTKVNVKECSDNQHLMDLSNILYDPNNFSLFGRILPIFDP